MPSERLRICISSVMHSCGIENSAARAATKAAAVSKESAISSPQGRTRRLRTVVQPDLHREALIFFLADSRRQVGETSPLFIALR